MIIPKSSIISSISVKAKKFPKEFQIECDDTNHITFKEIVELFLFVKGAKRFEWIDNKGNKEKANNIFINCVRLLGETFFYPFRYLGLRLSIAGFRKNREAPKTNLNNILFLRTDHWFNISSGGSVGHLKGVIDGFRELGFKLKIVSSDHLTGVNSEQDFLLCSPVYSAGRNIPDIPELLYNKQLLKYIKANWNTLNPSFIYQRYSKGNYAGVALKNKYNIPYICEYNGSLAWISKKWYGHKVFHEKLINKIELLNLKSADIIVVVSEEMKDELLERGIEENKILINPNGVDPSVYSPEIDGSSIKVKYSLDGKIVIGFIGTFGRWHGAEVLAESFGIMLNENTSLRNKLCLLLIGDGVTMPEVKENIKKYNIENEVILTGQIPQAEGPLHLAACDILVSPHIPTPDGTKFFGSPTKLFEYMAMGKPIVASNLNQIGRILENNKTAILTKPGDPNSLKEGILRLIDDKELRSSLGINAREKVISEYTWKNNVKRVIEKLKNG